MPRGKQKPCAEREKFGKEHEPREGLFEETGRPVWLAAFDRSPAEGRRTTYCPEKNVKGKQNGEVGVVRACTGGARGARARRV